MVTATLASSMTTAKPIALRMPTTGRVRAASGIRLTLGSIPKGTVMDRRVRAKFEARARIVKALAHPGRPCIVDQHPRQKRCVAELTRIIGPDMCRSPLSESA
jgi:hypothetical protein